MPKQKATWKEANIAGLVATMGTNAGFKTGTWRTLRPVHDMDNCTNCLLCWVYCPDSAIIVKDGHWVAFDYDHCKGCGICASVCPAKVDAHEITVKAGKVIQMVMEEE